MYLFILIAKESGPVHWVRFGHSRRRPAEYGKQALPHMPIPLVKFGYLTCPNERIANSLACKIQYVFEQRRRPGGEWFQFDLSAKDERKLLFDAIDTCARNLSVCTTITQVDPESMVNVKTTSHALGVDNRKK